MTRALHPVAGGVAILVIAIFWLSTAISELSGSDGFVVLVKTLIPWGFLLLIPALAAAGGTGFALAGGRPVGRTGGRAGGLAAKARSGDFDAAFYGVQAVELVAGAFNLWLLARNAIDGRQMTAPRRRARPRR